MISAVAGTTTHSATTTPGANKQPGNGNFAQLLASASGTTAAGETATSAASVAPRTMLGSAFAAQMLATPQEERDFTSELTRRLRAAGVDTSKPIQFQVGSDGSVVAKDGTPDKQKIDAIFAADPALANEYRKIANTEEIAAIVRTEQAYENEAKGLDSAAQSALWQRYAGLIRSMQAHGGELTLAGASLSFEG